VLTPEQEAPEQQAKRISVIIVSFNRKASLRKSLAALGDAHQVIVIDNGSTDGTPGLAEEFPAARLVRLPKNFGLTKALNVGIRAADGTYILLLHDDTLISGEAVTRLADYLEENAEAGAACPLLVHGGAPAPQVRALPAPSDPDPVLTPAGATRPECVSGAAIMFRTSFLRALRQIDERYGNYGNTIELCYQVKRANRRIAILHDITAEHEGGESPMSRAALEGDRAAGTALFLSRHHGFMAGLLYRIKTALGALFTFRFKTVSGALSGAHIDGTS
jgi:GT2 family glycosyltransferase